MSERSTAAAADHRLTTGTARSAAIGAFALGLAGLLGWLFDSSFLRNAGAGVDMNPAAALVLVLGGLGVWAVAAQDGTLVTRRLGQSCGVVIMLMMGARLGQLIYGWPVPVDGFLVPGHFAGVADDNPARLTAGFAILYMLLGTALLLAARRSPNGRLVGRSIAIFLAAASALSVLGNLARVIGPAPSKLAPSVAISTIVGVLILSLGIVAIAGRREDPVTTSDAIRALQSRVALTLRIAMGVVVLTASLSLWGSLRSREAALHRTQAVAWRGQLRRVSSTVQQADAGQRGYLLTGDSTFLSRYRVAIDSIGPLLDRLAAVPSESGEQAGAAVSLAALIRAKSAELALTIDLRKRGLVDSALRIVRSGVGEKATNDIQEFVTTLNAQRDTVVARWDARLRTDDGITLSINLLGGIIAIIFLGLAGRAIGRDLVYRAEEEAMVRSSEARLSTIIDLMPQPVSLKDPETLKFIRFNQAGAKLLGFGEQDLIGKSVFDFFSEEDAKEWTALDRAALASRDVFESPLQTIHDRNGGEVMLHTKRVAIRDEHGRPIFLLAISEDITDRLRHEAVIREARDAAERANRAKSDFLAKMSHELRTPLNSIIGFSEILGDETAGPLNPKQHRYVSNVLVSGRNLLDLINDILDLSKVEAGRMEVTASTFDVKAALTQVCAIVEAMAEKKHLSLKVEVPDDLPELTADRGKVVQIMYNLVGNALKFTPERGEVLVRASVLRETDVSVGHDWLEVAVSDTGIGIAKENLERIFGEFEQVTTSRHAIQEGTGLGLALTRRLVQLHGGRIWVESELGLGSTFRFILPLRAPTLAPALAVETTGDGQGPLVLVIDDEAQARDLLRHYLTGAGYRVIAAAKGNDAVRLAQESRPDVITLDILMPDRDGFHTLTELKASPGTRDIPVVVVSVTDRPDQDLDLGLTDWLVKPVQPAALVAAVERTIGSSTLSPRTVLVIDDDVAVVEYLTDLLHREGVTVFTATGGWSGVELAVWRLPDLIVLDLMMPDLDGFGVIRTLRAHPDAEKIPIVILTAKDLTASEIEALRRSVQGIVRKGGRDDLVAELQRIIPVLEKGVPR